MTTDYKQTITAISTTVYNSLREDNIPQPTAISLQQSDSHHASCSDFYWNSTETLPSTQVRLRPSGMRLSWMRCKSLLYLGCKASSNCCSATHSICAPGAKRLHRHKDTAKFNWLEHQTSLENKGSDTMAVKHCVQKIHEALPRSSTEHLNLLLNCNSNAPWSWARAVPLQRPSWPCGNVTQSQNIGPDNRPKSEHLRQDQKMKPSLF